MGIIGENLLSSLFSFTFIPKILQSFITSRFPKDQYTPPIIVSWILWIFGLTQSIHFKLSQLNTSIVSNFESYLSCEWLMLIITLYVIHITDWILIIMTESPIRRTRISSSRSHRFSCVETHQLHSVSCKRVTERMKSVEISFLSSYLVQSIHLPSILQANRLTAIICLLKNDCECCGCSACSRNSSDCGSD